MSLFNEELFKVALTECQFKVLLKQSCWLDERLKDEEENGGMQALPAR